MPVWDMPFWAELLITALLIVAGFFGLVGSFALIRLPSAMARLHGPTKATTLGIGGVLIASMVHSIAAEGTISAHELLISIFLFLTSPITALFIAKVHLHQHESPESLPDAGVDDTWASYGAEGPARGVRDFPADAD